MIGSLFQNNMKVYIKDYYMIRNSFLSLKITKQKAEYYLIISTIIFSFFYFVFRSIIMDNFIWIIIFPCICIVYKLMDTNRLRSITYTRLDKLIFIYLSFGISMTVIGVLIAPDKINTIEIFSHFYLPSVIYFIARNYTAVSMFNIIKVIKLIWVLAIILIIDIVTENYIYSHHSSTMIPWVAVELKDVGRFASVQHLHESGYDKILTLLTSSKTAGMVMASFFCFIFPFSLKKELRKYFLFINIKSIIINRLINLIILVSILFCSIGILVTNKTSLLSIIMILLVFILIERSFKVMLMTLLSLLFLGFVFYNKMVQMFIGTFITQYTHIFDTNLNRFGSSVFTYIFDFSTLIEGYKGHQFFDYIFGKYIISGSPAGNPFPFQTELRIFSTPLYFGLFWTIIILMLAYYILKICFRLIKSKKQSFFHYLGLSFFGFFMIYFLDIHYPVFFRHGPIELLFVMMGTLSSCYMFEKQPYQELNGKDYYGFNI